jgi:hypothetical protein
MFCLCLHQTSLKVTSGTSDSYSDYHFGFCNGQQTMIAMATCCVNITTLISGDDLASHMVQQIENNEYL